MDSTQDLKKCAGQTVQEKRTVILTLQIPKENGITFVILKSKVTVFFLDQNPISIYNKDTAFSASDGAFYYYSGTLQKDDTTVLFNFDELFCDYCGVPTRVKSDGTTEVIKRTKQWKGSLTDKGIIINGYLYARTTKKEIMISEHPKAFLQSQ